jgi:SNF2 family DNA or RNA helicase
MNLLKFENLGAGRWAMRTGYHHLFPDLAKTVPGMKWTPKGVGAWVGYADSVNLLTKKLEEAKIVKVAGPRPPSRAPLSIKDFKYDSGYNYDYGLREYQKIGTSFLINTMREGTILADGMGAGKSAQCLAAINEIHQFPAVIICPANVKSNWQKEAKRIGLDAHILFGMSPPKDCQLDPSDGIVVLNYELVDSWLPHLQKVKIVAFDEAQALSNEKSKRSKACKTLAHRAKYRVALTGTPIQNRAKELWNIVDTISPNRLGSWMPYMKRYAGAYQEDVPVRGGEEGETQKVWNVKGASHTEELNERLKYFMLRRTKQDVKLEIPSKTRSIIELDVSKEYKNPDRWWTLENKTNAQIALGLAAEGKVEQAVELALTAIDSGSKPTLWMHRKEVCKALQKRLRKEGVNTFMLTGDETPKKREENALQASKTDRAVTIATFEAVGTGINYLVYSDIGVFVELHYVPGKMLQAEDRHHRPGQELPVSIYYLIALGSIDEMIRAAVLSKLRDFENIIGNVGDNIRDELLGVSEADAMEALRKTLMEDEGGK